LDTGGENRSSVIADDQKPEYKHLVPKVKVVPGSGGPDSPNKYPFIDPTIRLDTKGNHNHIQLATGVFAKTLLLPGESVREFRALARGLVRDLRPSGVMECMYIEQMVVHFWFWRRCVKVESDSVRKRVGNKSGFDAISNAIMALASSGSNMDKVTAVATRHLTASKKSLEMFFVMKKRRLQVEEMERKQEMVMEAAAQELQVPVPDRLEPESIPIRRTPTKYRPIFNVKKSLRDAVEKQMKKDYEERVKRKRAALGKNNGSKSGEKGQ